jgi:hypothetical protein
VILLCRACSGGVCHAVSGAQYVASHDTMNDQIRTLENAR